MHDSWPNWTLRTITIQHDRTAPKSQSSYRERVKACKSQLQSHGAAWPLLLAEDRFLSDAEHCCSNCETQPGEHCVVRVSQARPNRLYKLGKRQTPRLRIIPYLKVTVLEIQEVDECPGNMGVMLRWRMLYSSPCFAFKRYNVLNSKGHWEVVEAATNG